MAKELGEPRVVAEPQREQVAFAVEHDRLPPALGETLFRDALVARAAVVRRRAGCRGGGRFAGRGSGDGAFGFGLGRGAVDFGLGHDRSPEKPKGRRRGPLAAELMVLSGWPEPIRGFGRYL